MSIHDGQYIWMLRTPPLLLSVHLHCQPLTLQRPHHLHARTEQGSIFFLLKKGCNKLLLTFILNFHTSCPLVSSVITKLRLLHSEAQSILSCVLCGHVDIYTFDNLGPFIPARRMWHFVPNQPQDVQAEYSALLSLLLTHRPNSRFGPAGRKMKILL